MGWCQQEVFCTVPKSAPGIAGRASSRFQTICLDCTYAGLQGRLQLTCASEVSTRVLNLVLLVRNSLMSTERLAAGREGPCFTAVL